MTEKTINLMIAGVGPHARRFYLPAIAALGGQFNCRLVAAIELESGRDTAMRALRENGLSAECLTVNRFESKLPDDTKMALDSAANRLCTNALIVATDPLAHLPFVLWALERGMDVLLDKPISTRRNAVSNLEAAQGIENDFGDILKAINQSGLQRQSVVSVCAHRRYHPGIEEAIRIIRDVCRKTGCPVTDIHAHHADGQWRLPEEIRTQDHHSYHSGHGKASHSGHHFFDCVYRFFKAGEASGKMADAMRVYSTFIQPSGLLWQLNYADYLRLFGEAYNEACPYSDEQLTLQFRDFGEVDLNAAITFLHKDLPVGQASLNLLHNSFSRRGWLQPSKDLYKGNGRVKHEHHRIHVGPFMTVSIHSYQSKSNHATNNLDELQLGGNNHFEIHVFRNSSILGGKEVEIIQLDKLAGFDHDKLFIEQVKDDVVVEFFRYLSGQLPRKSLRSPLEDHAIPVQMLSAVYESHVNARMGKNPVIVKSLWR